MRAEVKANYLLQNGGAFRELALSEHAFAIVIRKELLTTGDPHDLAWTFLLQRLERLTTKRAAQIVLFHDEGDNMRVRIRSDGGEPALRWTESRDRGVAAVRQNRRAPLRRL
jgi:hypothetical protein